MLLCVRLRSLGPTSKIMGGVYKEVGELRETRGQQVLGHFKGSFKGI